MSPLPVMDINGFACMPVGLSRKELLVSAVNGITTDGRTALYDAIYAGVYQTYFENGAKCVIAFTDGEENASSYSFNDVVTLAKNTGPKIIYELISIFLSMYALSSSELRIIPATNAPVISATPKYLSAI